MVAGYLVSYHFVSRFFHCWFFFSYSNWIVFWKVFVKNFDLLWNLFCRFIRLVILIVVLVVECWLNQIYLHLEHKSWFHMHVLWENFSYFAYEILRWNVFTLLQEGAYGLDCIVGIKVRKKSAKMLCMYLHNHHPLLNNIKSLIGHLLTTNYLFNFICDDQIHFQINQLLI